MSNTPEPAGSLRISHYFLLILLLAVLYACYRVLGPYWNPIILAAILSMVFAPLHQEIEDRLKGRKGLAASLSCIGLTLIVIIPLILILIAIIHQGVQSFHAISQWIGEGNLERLLSSPWVRKVRLLLEKIMPDLQSTVTNFDMKDLGLSERLLGVSSQFGKFLLGQSGEILGNITSLVGKGGLMLFVFFFMLRDREKIAGSISRLLPMSRTHKEEVASKIRNVARSALFGTFLTAAAQGAAGGLAFWIAGLPGFFWGVMMAFASLIPIVGTALIWVPASVYLFLVGRWGYGIFIVLWCAILVGMIDNFVRPLFMKGPANMSTFLIFFSILGGISTFGLIGLLYGPLLFGLAVVLLYIYQLEFRPFLGDEKET